MIEGAMTPRNPIAEFAELFRRLAGSHSLIGSFQDVLAFTGRELSAETLFVTLLNAESGEHRMVAAQGLDEGAMAAFAVPQGSGVAGTLTSAGVKVVLPGAGAATDGTALHPGEAAALAGGAVLAPILSQERVVGALAARLKTAEAQPSEAETHALGLGATLCQWTLGNVDLYQSLEQRVREFTAILEIGREIASTLEVERVLDLIIDRTLQLAGCETCSIMLLDDARTHLAIRKAVGLPEEVVKSARIPVGQGIAGGVAASGTALLLKDIETAGGQGVARKNRSHYRTRSLLSVPLQYRGETIGVLNVNNKKGDELFTLGDLNLLTLFASQAAIALQNARLHSQLQQMAVTDGLTGLYNRAHFMRELEVEFRHSQVHGTNLTVLMCDVDHFKRVNDEHGHAAGDEVLRGVAEVLRSGVREGDIVGRYGGEEFVVLLRRAPMRIANMVAERLRERVAETGFLGGELRVTVSLGVAGMANDVPRPDDLVARADAELYRAKNTGRNRVCAFASPG
jgi:diguanylate cyclase (GGDEF)-like protein